MSTPASTDFPVHPLIAERWSPRAFDGSSISTEDLGSLFEAARWSASCFNEQPWRFLIARRDDDAAFQRLLGCLVEFNQSWAKNASVLVITAMRHNFERNDKPNKHAGHDLGLAVGSLTTQAQSMGLHLHQMGGIDPDKARADCGIPDGFEALTAIAIGRQAEPDVLPAELAERERAPRERKQLGAIAFGATWSESAEFAAG